MHKLQMLLLLAVWGGGAGGNLKAIGIRRPKNADSVS